MPSLVTLNTHMLGLGFGLVLGSDTPQNLRSGDKLTYVVIFVGPNCTPLRDLI